MSTLATYHGPAFTGWRSWRILPHDTLNDEPTIRLAASGTRGIPKLWEPRSALRAVCGKFETTHDAPWASCECGVHAYADRVDAEDHLRQFVDATTNGIGVLGWAFGRVSLWGRIVEHEIGWRAEYAYPYEVTVHGTLELAAAVRRLYLVDVERAEPLTQAKIEADDDAEAEDLERALTNLTPRIRRLRTITTPTLAPAPTPTPAPVNRPKRLRDVIEYDDSGKRRSSPSGFIESELWRSAAASDLGCVRTARLAIDMMRRAGVDDYEPTSWEVSELAPQLWKLAMRHEICRISQRGTTGRLWARWTPDAATCEAFDLAADDPTIQHLDRDTTLIRAIYQAGNGEDVHSKDVTAALDEALGKQLPTEWSQSFVRCVVRGWATNTSRRIWKPTWLGTRVAQTGTEPRPWQDPYRPERRDCSFRRDQTAVASLLEGLEAAVHEKGGPVTAFDVGEQFQATTFWWTGPGPGPAHAQQIANRLRVLADDGLVEASRPAGAKYVHWQLKGGRDG